MSDAMLRIRNRHTGACGDPPIISADDANLYLGYFENAFGEQWIFIFDRTTRLGELRGGDIGWNAVVRTSDGTLDNLILGPQELAWFQACWRSAIGRPS